MRNGFSLVLAPVEDMLDLISEFLARLKRDAFNEPRDRIQEKIDAIRKSIEWHDPDELADRLYDAVNRAAGRRACILASYLAASFIAANVASCQRGVDISDEVAFVARGHLYDLIRYSLSISDLWDRSSLYLSLCGCSSLYAVLAVAARACGRPVVASVVDEPGAGTLYSAARIAMPPYEFLFANVPAYTGPEAYIPVFNDDGRLVAQYVLAPRSPLEVHHGVLYRLGRDNILRPARVSVVGVARAGGDIVSVYSERLAELVASTGVERDELVLVTRDSMWKREVGGRAVIAPAAAVRGDSVEPAVLALVEEDAETVKLVELTASTGLREDG